MDFIIELLKSKESTTRLLYDLIIIMVDKFNKIYLFCIV